MALLGGIFLEMMFEEAGEMLCEALQKTSFFPII